MESEGMLRHLAFFEELGNMEETNSSWHSVSAGLVVLRLLDAWIEDGVSVVMNGSWSLSAVIEAVEKIEQLSPTRRILLGVIDAMRSSTTIDLHVVTPRLMAFAQALEYEARWSLAADVYHTIVAHGHPTEDGDVVVPAAVQLGLCLRNLGDLEGAAEAYSSASRIADANGDMIGVLRARIGEAKLATVRGNIPEAEAILDQTIEHAGHFELNDVHSRALHDRAVIAGARGQYDRAVQFAYRALELSTSLRERDRILGDVATGFLYLGLVDVARDAYLILVATAQDQYVRWTAGLNLIEVASREGMEPMFDRYRRDFESVDLPPYLQAAYLLNVGNGYRSFGRERDAIVYLQKAVEVAAENQLNQLLFEAEESLAAARSSTTRKRHEPAANVSADVLGIAQEIRDLRMATTGAS